MRTLLLSILLTLLLFMPARATSIQKLTFDEVLKNADLVFLGRVSDLSCRLAEGDSRFPIWTDVRFSDLTVLKGKAGTSHVLSLAGGQVGERGFEIVGMPRLVVGERCLVMAVTEKKTPCPIVGWKQGVFRIVPDPETGVEHVEDGFGRAVTEIRGGLLVPMPPTIVGEKAPDRLTLVAFLEDIRIRNNRHTAEARESEAKERARENNEEEERR